MNRDLLRKTQSQKSQASLQKEQTVIIAPGAKLHRANILARIIHSLSLYKMEWALNRLKIISGKRKSRHRRMGLIINRIFRRNVHQDQFQAMNKLKKQLLQAQQHEIIQSEKIIQTMSKASKNIIFLVLKAKRRQILQHTFSKIKQHSIQSHTTKRNNQRKSIRKILEYIFKNKKYAFQKLYTSRLIEQRKIKLRHLSYVLHMQRKYHVGWGFWKLRRNLLEKRREQVESDIKMFQLKINSADDPEMQAIKEKKDKLEEHLNKVQQQKTALQEQFMHEFREVQKRRQQIQSQISSLQQKKQSLQSQVQTLQQQVSSAYSLDQIYQCIYNNFLLYLSQNKQRVYNKEQLLSTLTYPLIPIDISIDIIKQQNKVMQQLLTQYIVMFGHRKLEAEICMPYQFLVKENKVMYKMLLTLLPQVEGDRDDLRIVRDVLFKLSGKVGEVWGK